MMAGLSSSGSLGMRSSSRADFLVAISVVMESMSDLASSPSSGSFSNDSASFRLDSNCAMDLSSSRISRRRAARFPLAAKSGEL